MGKFEIILRKNNEYQFNLKASNGQVILSSEGYTTKENCKRGIQSVKINAAFDHSFERKTSKNLKYFFNLKSTNGQIIGTSELYESESSRENGIYSVQRNAPEAEVVDLTY